MKKTKEVTELRDKTVAELEVLADQLKEEVSSERVMSYFGDQTSTNDVQSKRKKLARILTILSEKGKEGDTDSQKKEKEVEK